MGRRCDRLPAEVPRSMTLSGGNGREGEATTQKGRKAKGHLGERVLRGVLTCLGDVTQQSAGQSLGQQASKGMDLGSLWPQGLSYL